MLIKADLDDLAASGEVGSRACAAARAVHAPLVDGAHAPRLGAAHVRPRQSAHAPTGTAPDTSGIAQPATLSAGHDVARPHLRPRAAARPTGRGGDPHEDPRRHARCDRRGRASWCTRTTGATRALAYPIERHADAEYRLLQFHASTPELLSELDRTLRITDGILRFRIVKLEPGTPDAPDMRTGASATVAHARPAETQLRRRPRPRLRPRSRWASPRRSPHSHDG